MPAINEGGFLCRQANDANYDGNLANVAAPPGVFFSSTLVHDNLPATTPYPRDAPQGTESHRVRLDIANLNLSQYSLFLVQDPTRPRNSNTNQIHLAFAQGRNNVEWCDQHLRRLSFDMNGFFEFHNDLWYAPDPPFWTNIFMIPEQPEGFLMGVPKKWDVVKK